MRYNPKRHRLPICDVSGIIAVDKPAGWTSFDVVNFVRARYNVPKVGHCGTLDPAATGLLILTLGNCTKDSAALAGADKTYEATLRLGTETDSGDLDGNVLRSDGDWQSVSRDALMTCVKSFEGEQLQVPPMVSAVKVGGKKLYELARQGVEIEREPRKIFISRLDVTRFEPPEADFTVTCSKGTYIRVLCVDMGKKLGCGGVLAKLRRTRSGNFDIAQAVTVDEIKQIAPEDFKSFVNEKGLL